MDHAFTEDEVLSDSVRGAPQGGDPGSERWSIVPGASPSAAELSAAFSKRRGRADSYRDDL